ncbi:MAG: tetratricopeptide repeat protein [Pseudomonadota bacterium]
MSDWGRDLETALASGDAARMTEVLAQVPREVVLQGAPQLLAHARRCVRAHRPEDAVACYDRLLAAAPERSDWLAERATALLASGRPDAAARDARRLVELAPMRAQGHRLLADACEALDELDEALAALRRALHCEPGDPALKTRIAEIEGAIRQRERLREALDPEAAMASLRAEPTPPPLTTFDPALFEDASMPADADATMLDGLRRHLHRYSGQASCKHAIARLGDPIWIDAWDRALAQTAGCDVLFAGSELGVFALRALDRGARRARIAEAHPLDARIADGIVHKHFLKRWHARHADDIPGWSEEARREAFQQFAAAVEIAALEGAALGGADPEGDAPADARCDAFVFPALDHTLLGTGLLAALRRFRRRMPGSGARVLPGRATLYAMGIRSNDAPAGFRLAPLDRLRWSPYPQPLELPPETRVAMTEPVALGAIDFASFDFASFDAQGGIAAFEAELPVSMEGEIDGVAFWYALDLGVATIHNAPPEIDAEGERLRCIRPALQYTDPVTVRAGGRLRVRAQVREHRLRIAVEPAASLPRTQAVPAWFLARQLDRTRNAVYRDAIAAAVARTPPALALELGAGCGLLSMMAAQSGAERVVASEAHPTLCAVGEEIVAANGFAERVRYVGKDSRRLEIPADLPQRADLALFEMFDCSLIGEGVLHFLAHARDHLLAEGARCLPMAGTIRAMLIECRFDRIRDIDANLLNPYRYAPGFETVDAAALDYRPLSASFDVFAFDFANADPTPQEREFALPAIADGAAGAVLFWFELRLDAERTLSNAPDAAAPAHWKQGLQWLPEAHVDVGAAWPLIAKHNGSRLQFQWKQGALPTGAFSKLPLFDPRWLAATTELEHRTQGLLQHCQQHPGEYAKVAELAKRFAIEPAAHGIDPAIAQRFAATFLGL